MIAKPAFTVVKSTTAGMVAVKLRTRARSWGGGTSLAIDAIEAIPTSAARELATSLIAHAEAEDARVARKEAEAKRRKAWRDREVAAGRMKVMSASEFFGRRS